MNVAGVVLMIGLIVAVVIAFSYTLLRTYIDRRESSALTSFISTMAISITLLCVMIIPVDIYIVSSDLNSDGSQSNPSLTHSSAVAIQSVYYGLYILLLIFAFILLPFTYFYFEEDSDDSTVASRTCSALKYTAGFLIFFVVLLALGLVLKKGKQDDTTDWRDKLSNEFTGGEAILSFCVGCLSCIGLCGYVVYAAYGLSRFPMKLMSRVKVAAPTLIGAGAAGGSDAASRTEDLELSLRRNQENIQYLQSSYDLSGRTWSKEDKKQMDDLKREQRRLQSLRQSRLRTGNARSKAGGDDADELTCCDKVWNVLVPIRLAIAIPLMLVSLLLIISLTIGVADKFSHSTCGPSCGYSLGKSHIVNPIDEAFRGLAKVFPLDCLFFGALVLYIFLCCVSGIVGLGVRFFMFKLYSIPRGRTLPNAFMMAAWLLQLMALCLNMEVLTLAPTYATFGNQFYFNVTSQQKQPCDTDLIGVIPDTCIQTQVGRFINTMSVESPFFAVILFYGNLAFLLFFFLFLGHGILCADNSKGGDGPDAFQKLDDLSD